MPSNEIVSCTPHDDINSKTAYRFRVWNLLENKDLVRFPRPCKGRIPNFVDTMVAAERLAAEDIFKNAQVVKVNIDKPQEPVRYNVLESGKTLLVASIRLADGFLVNVCPPPESDIYTLRDACKQRGAMRFSKPVKLDEKIHVDLIVVGSVAVSKEGYRIGKGEGFTDLEFGMMAACGMITERTTIVTTVHDEQVFDMLPHDLFQPFDVPVDFIVTPTRMIEVSPRLARPAGVLWHVLSDRKMQLVPMLKSLRDREIEKGNECKLKEVDSEPEDRPRPFFMPNRRPRPFYRQRRHDDNMRDGDGSASPAHEAHARPTRFFRRTRNPGRQRSSGGSGDDNTPRANGQITNGNRSDGRQSRDDSDGRRPNRRQPSRRRQDSGEGPPVTNGNQRPGEPRNRRPEARNRRQDSSYQRPDSRNAQPFSRNSEQHTDGENNYRKQSQRNPDTRRNRFARRFPVDFSIKVGNISSTVRVRDLKAALQEKGVRPLDIIWRGQRGFAFLNFGKLKKQPEQPTGVDDVIASLRDLTVKYRDNEEKREAVLTVEPAKPITRIEDAGVTAV